MTKSPPLLPFRIVVDVNESLPYQFAGIASDAKYGGLPWVVPTVTLPLYAMAKEPVEIRGETHLKGLADYSIDGMIDRVAIERKSLPDLYSTIGGRRDEFEAEIARLDRLECADVVIEADWHRILTDPPPSSRLLPKIVSRTIISWSRRYRNVHWHACASRRHAELMTFQLLFQFWRQKGQKTDDQISTHT